MKIEIKVNNFSIPAEVDDKYLNILNLNTNGYERVEKGQNYFTIESNNVVRYEERFDDCDDRNYMTGNYYSNKNIAENNDRAEKLMRCLRRFAAEHNALSAPFDQDGRAIYTIGFFPEDIESWEGNFKVCTCGSNEPSSFGAISFTCEEVAEAAIKEFHDELEWYFTEYNPNI